MPDTARPDPSAQGLVFLVDDDVLLCELVKRWVEDDGYAVRVFHDGLSVLEGLRQAVPDVVSLDLSMPGLDGVETLRLIKEHHPDIPIVVMTSHTEVERVVEVMRAGAYDYLEKPVEPPRFLTTIGNAVERSQLRLRLAQLERDAEGRGYPGIIGSSPVMKTLFRRLDRVAPTDVTVLIQGESGSGKELVARAIHAQSTRSKGPFIALNCAAIPESLQESELFGHEKGAFTGATARRAGAFERADQGTLFLDEIGELSASLQAKLLRALQERSFLRVGGSHEIQSDFRLVVATHKVLHDEMHEGRFREDLYFRIAVMDLEVPPLRDRKGDIPLLARHFLEQAEGHEGIEQLEFAHETVAALEAYRWPGNVRELENAVTRAAVEAGKGVVRPTHLPRRVRDGARGGAQTVAPRSMGSVGGEGASAPPKTLEEMERDAISRALVRHNGNLAQVVRELGIGRTTLYRKLKKYNLR